MTQQSISQNDISTSDATGLLLGRQYHHRSSSGNSNGSMRSHSRASSILYQCPETPQGDGMDNLFANTGDCVMNRTFRQVRDRLPFLPPDQNIFSSMTGNATHMAGVGSEEDGNEMSLAGMQQCSRTLGALRPGSKFNGRQQASEDSKTYPVEVDIKDVNLNESYLCGYLTIHNLTSEYPSLTTFFEAELIGPHHSFVTNKWDAEPIDDQRHWSKFPYFAGECQHYLTEDPLWSQFGSARRLSTGITSIATARADMGAVSSSGMSSAQGPGSLFEYLTRGMQRSAAMIQAEGGGGGGHQQRSSSDDDNSMGEEVSDVIGNRQQQPRRQRPIYNFFQHRTVFMRWKEAFLVPDHRIDNLHGASYAGFYYMAYDTLMETFEGYYFHKESRDFQRLLLSHAPTKTFGSFEFR